MVANADHVRNSTGYREDLVKELVPFGRVAHSITGEEGEERRGEERRGGGGEERRRRKGGEKGGKEGGGEEGGGEEGGGEEMRGGGEGRRGERRGEEKGGERGGVRKEWRGEEERGRKDGGTNVTHNRTVTDEDSILLVWNTSEQSKQEHEQSIKFEDALTSGTTSNTHGWLQS